MRKIHLALVLLVAVLSMTTVSCKKKDGAETHTEGSSPSFDAAQISGFFEKFPEFKPFEKQVNELYEKHQHHYIWYDKEGRIDVAEVLFNRANQMKADGVLAPLPYRDKFIALFRESESKDADLTKELMISSLYFFYAKNVLEGMAPGKSKQTGWYLPRDKVSYVDYLDELMKDPDKIKKDDEELISQYYKLRKGLQRYREIQAKGGWAKITMPAGKKVFKPGESDPVIAQVRKRLFITSDLAKDSGSPVLDSELIAGIRAYEERNNRVPEDIIDVALVEHLSVPVEQRIKTIIVNMERCRWIDADVSDAPEMIAVNIPSYKLHYLKEGKPVLISNVVVGKEANKTVVFSGQMSYIVFSPYWNVPPSILEKEIKPGIEANPNYLEEHNMEWNGESVRQRPGKNNSLGLVKFMFPNSNNIYLHDTPAKSLFGKESRAFSHGCVRVEKARELAIKILEGDSKWTTSKIDAAMNAGTESSYSLKRKIPVYIAYFTAVADDNGNVGFFEDIYSRDNRLFQMLYNES